MKTKTLITFLIISLSLTPCYAFSVDANDVNSCRDLKRECKAVMREDGELSSVERHACKSLFHTCKALQWFD